MFLPSPTKYTDTRHSARMKPGVFWGYVIHPGQKWNGEYRVADLSDYTGKSLHASEPSTSFNIVPHTTKSVRLTRHGVVFPLKGRYDRDNITLDGIEASTHGKEWGELPEAEQSQSKDPSGDALGSVVGVEKSAVLTGPSMALNLEPFVPEPEELYIAPPPIPQTSDDLVASNLIEKRADAPKYWIDTLGRPYPLDQYGNIIRKSNRPYGVSREDWEKASRAMRKRYREAFADLPPRPEVSDEWKRANKDETKKDNG